MALDRLQQNTAVTIYGGFAVDGTAEDPSPDTATVRVVQADGTELVAASSAADAGTGLFAKTLTAAQTAELGTLTAYWTAEVDGVEQTVKTTHEITGGFYFTVGEFYARYPEVFEKAATYTPAKVAEARVLAEDTLEDETGIVSVPRGGYVFAYGVGSLLTLPGWPIRSVSRVLDSDGSEVDLTYADIQGDTVSLSCWPRRALTVSYEYGRDRPKSTVKTAAMVLARELLVRGPMDDRETQRSNPDGSVINLSTPGLLGAVTGIPYVDQVIRAERLVSV